MLVYCCLNTVTGKVYVGKTAGSVERRWAQHLSSARGGSPILFHRALRKYGPAAFRVRIVATARTEEELNLLEIQTITELGSLVPGGYNLRAGGEGGAHSAATRATLRAMAQGRRLTPEHKKRIGDGVRGDKNGFFGKTHTDATKEVLREKCAQVTVGVPKSPEHCARISRGLTGKPKSPTHVQKMRENATGKVATEESKRKASEALKGVPKPPGFGARVSAAMKGRKFSPETLERMRAAAQLREARKRGEVHD